MDESEIEAEIEEESPEELAERARWEELKVRWEGGRNNKKKN